MKARKMNPEILIENKAEQNPPDPNYFQLRSSQKTEGDALELIVDENESKRQQPNKNHQTHHLGLKDLFKKPDSPSGDSDGHRATQKVVRGWKLPQDEQGGDERAQMAENEQDEAILLRNSTNENSSEIMVWGSNSNGQLGLGESFSDLSFPKVSLKSR